jgi:hypothetical protein
MTRDQLLSHQEAFCGRMTSIMKDKNRDYSGMDDDALKNFKLIENAYNVTSSEVGTFTRMSDKMSRLASFIRNGELVVKDESVQDTLIDLANYAVLLSAQIVERRDRRDEFIKQGQEHMLSEESPLKVNVGRFKP